MPYALVILPIASPKLYTYSIPDVFLDKIKKGQRVVVQVRNRLYTGIVAGFTEENPKYEVKPIEEILDSEPLIPENYLELWQWIADYYMCTLGEVYTAALPSSLRLEGQHTVYPVETDLKNILLTDIEKEILAAIKKKPLTLNNLQKKIGVKNIVSFTKSLVEKGLVRIDQVVENPFKPKTQKFVSLSPEINTPEKLEQTINSLSRAKKQTELVLAYISLAKPSIKNPNPLISKQKLLEKVDSISAYQALLKRNIFVEVEKTISRFDTKFEQLRKINPLTPAQQKAFEQINTLFEQKDTVLLFGVTSSGKTEIYLHLIKQYLAQGKQVLYLLPEIAITTQIIYRIQAVFGQKVGIYHSKLNDSERAEVWKRTAGMLEDLPPYQIIIGVRSAIFLPFKNLGLVIVDEEHENTYKQFDPAPRYNARDVAIVLAKKFKAKVLLGTATPSIESYWNAQKGKYGLVTLTQRFQDIKMPQIILADTRLGQKQRKMHGIFHKVLLDEIKKTLEQKQQVILFRNRRGFAPYLECQDCGWIPKCKFCDVSLTYHKETNKLVCHYCGYTIEAPRRCENCGSFKLRLKSYGTERVEDEIAVFFPDAKVQRLDLDTTRRKNAYAQIIERFEKGEIDILVGTQMVTKGLDFENVRLVGILNADSLLNYPDFRSYERAFQLMVQVSGRAGRKNAQGLVIIQTAHPDHQVFKYVIENNYTEFFKWQIKERQDFSYPPFTRIIKITVKDKSEQLVNDFSKLLAYHLRKHLKHRVLGPEFPLVKKVQTWYKKEIVIKIEPKLSLSKVKKLIINTTNQLKQRENYYRIFVIYDVDPM